MEYLNVEYLGYSFDARNVTSKSKELFISSFGGSRFVQMPDEERKAALGEVYDMCQQEVAKAIAEQNKSKHAEQDEPLTPQNETPVPPRRTTKPRKASTADEEAGTDEE